MGLPPAPMEGAVVGAGCHCSLPEGGHGVPGTIPSLIYGVRSLQPPWRGPGWGQHPYTPSPSWCRGPSVPLPQFLLFVLFPQGLWLGGLLVLLPFFISVNNSEEVSRCRRGVFISARSGKRQVHPRKAIFSHHMPKKRSQGAPCSLSPKPCRHYWTLSLRQ